MKNRLILILILLVCGLLFFFLSHRIFHQPGMDPVAQKEKARVDSANARVRAAERANLPVIDSYKVVVSDLKAKLAQQTRRADAAEKQAIVSISHAEQLARGVEQARQQRDTSGYIENCDSLPAAVYTLSQDNARYRAENDSLKTLYQKTIAAGDTLARRQADLLATERDAVHEISDSYYQSYAREEKLFIRNRRARGMVKILGITTAIEFVLLFSLLHR